MNGPELEMIGHFPFVLSLSKHSEPFFSKLLVFRRLDERLDTQPRAALRSNLEEPSDLP
jgi:hypothetical protein